MEIKAKDIRALDWGVIGTTDIYHPTQADIRGVVRALKRWNVPIQWVREIGVSPTEIYILAAHPHVPEENNAFAIRRYKENDWIWQWLNEGR